MSNKVGRPRKFQSPVELQKQVDDYFKYCEKNDEPLTVSGLSYALDTTRETLLDYQSSEYGEEYAHIIRRAKERIQYYLEKELLSPYRKNVTGLIFNLKNNYDWKDRKEIDTKTTHVFQQVASLSDEELKDRIARLERNLEIAQGAELLEVEEVEEVVECEECD